MHLQVEVIEFNGEMYVNIEIVSGDDTCFWRGECNKLNLGTPIFFM